MFYRKHSRVLTSVGTRSRTKQEFKQDCDITHILRQFQRTGIITHVQSARPEYTDLPDDMDYQASLAIIEDAHDAFRNLPSVVRSYFQNDVSLFLSAFSDPAQHAKLVEFGLVKQSEPPAAAASNEPGKAGGGGDAG